MSAPPSEMILRLPIRSDRPSDTRTAPLSRSLSRPRSLSLAGSVLVALDVALRMADVGGEVLPNVLWVSAAACFVVSFALAMGAPQ